jgi:hypothetical protein
MGEPSAKIVEALEAAVAAVKVAKVPKDLRVAAFNAAFYGSDISPASAADTLKPPPLSQLEDGANGVEKIAAKLRLEPAVVGQVFEVEDTTVHLLVSSSAFSSTKAVAQQEITQLIVAARQASGVDEDLTAVESVRALLDDFGVLDRNFSSNINGLKGRLIRFAGTPTKRQFKMNQPGFEAAAEIVKRLTE